jgi:glycosyltransferase involved in cell wall biosynthesis
LFAPQVFLAQARRWQRLLARAGATTIDFPNWTDFARFHPVAPGQRAELRASFGLPLDRPVLLHVGHVKANRNLSALIAAQRCGRYQVWVVGSESESQPGPWRHELELAGVRVDSRFFPEIERVYQAADVYVFTVRAIPSGEFPHGYNEVGVIDMPLSVLEARACGLPVLSTRHDALEHFLASDRAVHWFDGSGDDCLARLDSMRSGAATFDRLDDGFDRRHLAARLDAIYSNPVSSG